MSKNIGYLNKHSFLFKFTMFLLILQLVVLSDIQTLLPYATPYLAIWFVQKLKGVPTPSS